MADNPKIEKGIPIPKIAVHRGRWKKLLDKMEIGDSFQVVDQKEVASLRNSIRVYILTHKKKERWTVKKFKDGQWRCWRTK